MLPCGLIVSGYYLGQERTEDRDGKPQTVIGVATGLSSVKVYMKSGVSLDGCAFGVPVAVSCRAYAGKNGVVYVDGTWLQEDSE